MFGGMKTNVDIYSMTTKQIHKKFEKELNELLQRYEAQMMIEDLGAVWGMEDKKIVVDFGWTEDNGYSQLILGTYVG